MSLQLIILALQIPPLVKSFRSSGFCSHYCTRQVCCYNIGIIFYSDNVVKYRIKYGFVAKTLSFYMYFAYQWKNLNIFLYCASYSFVNNLLEILACLCSVRLLSVSIFGRLVHHRLQKCVQFIYSITWQVDQIHATVYQVLFTPLCGVTPLLPETS